MKKDLLLICVVCGLVGALFLNGCGTTTKVQSDSIKDEVMKITEDSFGENEPVEADIQNENDIITEMEPKEDNQEEKEKIELEKKEEQETEVSEKSEDDRDSSVEQTDEQKEAEEQLKAQLEAQTQNVAAENNEKVEISRVYTEDCGTDSGYWTITYSDGTIEYVDD